MKFVETALAGAFVIEPERHEDSRGFFGRVFCREEFAQHGLVTDYVQSSVSFNTARGTLRGMHMQRAPDQETKLVRCTAGAIHDVIVDLRPGSPTYLQWVAVELSAASRATLYVPKGLAHGFLTLTDGTEITYSMDTLFAPRAAVGLRWNDPALAIDWPAEPTTMSDRDRSYPDYDPRHPL